MFAKDLEFLLTSLFENADVWLPYDFEERFKALRGYKLLPAKRENREKRLTDAEIANAIFGGVSAQAGWAAQGAKILQTLKPVGGVSASFMGAVTLQDAVVQILSNKEALDAVTSLQVSLSENSTNSNGFATLSYACSGKKSKAFYVPGFAVSKFTPGAELVFDSEEFYSPVVSQRVFTKDFFMRVVTNVERSRKSLLRASGDGSEYNDEEENSARLERLRVNPRSKFLNVGVDNQVTWPRSETVVEFDKYFFVLMPKTKQNVQSIHFDLASNHTSISEARTIINRFLSVLTWCDDQFSIMQDGWAGNPVPVPVKKRNLAFTTAHEWLFDWQMPTDPDVQRALAFYREGRNAEQNFLVSYAVLSFYKILEIRYPDGEKTRAWISENFPELQNLHQDAAWIREFTEERGDKLPERHIYDAYRLAVAHASKKSRSDPDRAEELSRLHGAAEVLRHLARFFISNELQVTDSRINRRLNRSPD